MNDQSVSVRKWIEDLPKRGRITFSMTEAESRFSHMSKMAVRSSIYRLIEKGRLYSVWRGFYVIIPDEHALKGFVPPIEYIESLMAYTGNKYYVGLLSAAALHGAGHQQPQILTVVTDSNDIRSIGNKSIAFFAKALIPESNLLDRNVGLGKVTLSSPELTALDLVYYENRVGGLNRVVEIINELDIDFKKTKPELLRTHKTPVIQRLGYILENALSLDEHGADLYSLSQAEKIRFRKTPLDSRQKLNDNKYPENDKWNIIVNCDLEADK